VHECARPSYVQTYARGSALALALRAAIEERRRLCSSAALRRAWRLCSVSGFIAGAFLGAVLRGAQQCGEDRDRGGVFDPFGQSLLEPGSARVFGAGPADRCAFLRAERSARRPPHFAPPG
jgi:hypothetical protein